MKLPTTVEAVMNEKAEEYWISMTSDASNRYSAKQIELSYMEGFTSGYQHAEKERSMLETAIDSCGRTMALMEGANEELQSKITELEAQLERAENVICYYSYIHESVEHLVSGEPAREYLAARKKGEAE